ncbi:MAG: PaaI family thioesterase [Flavobacteriaceae bacterium]|jgi:1,4-dihydroxy-2-naphthoyl-CoA hydrolase|nr:PaaI family thioesterase [Flavobacteriaceae bacterium]NBT87435.1 PaaI family thioesterase [Flavobacteriaceae bacterium]
MDTAELLQRINAYCKGTLMETLEIEYVAIDADSLTAKMPVTPKVHQPDGVLHGGATLALAESVGSAAAQVLMADKQVQIRGLELSGNHVKSVRSGYVWAKATILHRGKTTQLWQIHVTDDQAALVSVVKFTTMILNRD